MFFVSMCFQETKGRTVLFFSFSKPVKSAMQFYDKYNYLNELLFILN